LSKGNDRLPGSLTQTLLAASPYLVVHAVHQVQQYATPAPPNPPNILHQAQCNHGANISATNDISVLSNRVKLDNPFPVASADRTSPAMLASVLGTYILRLSDGTTCDIPIYFCPSISDTIISPQHFTTMDASHQLFNGYCLIDLSGCCWVLLSRSDTRDAVFIDLQKCNNLYFIAGSASVSSGSLISRVITKPQLLSEFWHQRLGHPGPTQPSALVKHLAGLPPHLTAGLHPMHSCQACNDGKIQHAIMGPTSDTAPIVSASRFHLDFGFIRASSHDFGVTKGPRAVTSYDGNNTYLLIVDAKQRYSWVFCQPSKSPHVSILE
jgi:hypothetical protein